MSQAKKPEKRSEKEGALQNKQEIDSLIAEAFKYIKSITFFNAPKRVSNKRVGKKRGKP